MSVIIVGKGGTLATVLSERLPARAIELRCPDPRDVSVVRDVAEASVVVNAGGPAFREDLGWEDYFREHVGTTTRIVRSMRPGTHLVQVSSAAVYGARGELVGPDSVTAPTRFPAAAYASAKLAAELAARTLGRERGIAVTVLRPSMLYGPGVDSVLSSIRQIARRGIVLQLEPLRLRQHLTHVDVLVEVVRRAAEAEVPHRAGGAERVLLVADPFVLRNEDVIPPGGGLIVPVPLDRALAAQDLARRLGVGAFAEVFRVVALDVLAMDNELDVAGTFSELGIDPARFAKDRTFDPYWKGA